MTLTREPCTRCGLGFWFAQPRPDNWTCAYCNEEIPSSAYGSDSGPLNRCHGCGGSGVLRRVPDVENPDICPDCDGSGEAA